MAQRRRTPSKHSEAPARVLEMQQRTNEMQAAFQQVAQRYGVRHLVIVVGERRTNRSAEAELIVPHAQ